MKNNSVSKEKTKKNIGAICWYSMLAIIVFIMFIPLVALLCMSFKPDGDLLYHADKLFPSKWTFDNYVNIFNLQGNIELNFFRSVANTLLITVCSVVGIVFTSALCAYGFMRFNVKENGFFFGIFMVGSMIPGQVLQIPIYEVYFRIGWINTFWPFIVPAFLGGGIFNIFLMRQFMYGIPSSIFESGELDGANEFQMFIKFVVPLSVPVFIVVGVFTFVGTWNDFGGPLIFLNDPEKFTLALSVYQFSVDFNSYTGGSSALVPWNLVAAINIISMLPILILYSCGQRYFTEGYEGQYKKRRVRY